jgi:endonuclease VIII
MPEGDTIHRTAGQLRKGILGRVVTSGEANAAGNATDVTQLVGCRVSQIEARGKHLLIMFDDRFVLHTHMGMTGSWHLYRVGEPWRKPARRAAVWFDASGILAVCFTPKTMEVLTPTAVRSHRHLSRLGPDLLVQPLDEVEILRRFRDGKGLSIGEAIMNQTVVCGVGNVYKSEVLFLERVCPFIPLERLTDERILRIVIRAATLMRRNLDGSRRTTRFSADGQRLWVYGRSGEPCLHCGASLQMRRQGDLGRSTYWCPRCQSPDTISSEENG